MKAESTSKIEDEELETIGVKVDPAMIEKIKAIKTNRLPKLLQSTRTETVADDKKQFQVVTNMLTARVYPDKGLASPA